MKNRSRQVVPGVMLLVFSALFYLLHYAVFRDAHHFFIYLVGDVKRAYSLTARHRLRNIEHLNASYPYLFSLAMRKNPFNPDASPVVR